MAPPYPPSQALGEPEPGTVFGNYRILSRIGQGSFATVFRAELRGEFGFRKPVALKVLHGGIGEMDERNALEFLREAQLGARIRHPNLVEFYECGRVGDRLYIALELVKGPNLSQLMRMPSERFGQITPEEVVIMAQQTARGLKGLHEARIAGQEIRPIHRDLKPANILISTEGQAKITDYGITRFAADFYRTMGGDDVRGSPLYMAPEQGRGEPVTQASDVFSFGLVFLSLLNGEPVFTAGSLRDVLERVTTGDVGDALAAGEERHPELAAVLARALAADPAGRLADGGALWESIKNVSAPAHGDEQLADLARRGKAELERVGAWQTAVDFELSDIHPALTAERNSLLDEDEHSQSLKDTTRWEDLGPTTLQRRTWWLIWALIIVGLLGATAQLVKVVTMLASP